MLKANNVILQESDKKPQDFYKTIKVKDKDGNDKDHTLLDYWKIWEDDAPIFVIMTERGAKGKSTQAKWLMKEIWNEFDLKSMWLMNTTKLIEKEKKSHLAKPKQYLDNYTGEETIKGDIILENPKDEETPDAWYAKFASLSTAENEKGSRDSFGLLVYDELNVGLSQIKNKQTDMVSSLIGTLTDPVNPYDDKFEKFIMHANFKSLNNQLLIDMGITSIKWEVTDVIDEETGLLNARVLCPILSEEEKTAFAENNKESWTFRFQKQLGKEGHVFYNENLHDTVNYCNTWMALLPFNERYYIQVGETIVEARFVHSEDLGDVLYFLPYEGKKEDIEGYIFAINVKDISEGVEEHKMLKKGFRRYLGAEAIYFMFPYLRDLIIGELRR